MKKQGMRLGRILSTDENADPSFPAWKLSRDGSPPPRVDWWVQQPLAFIGAWEPLSFRRRAGYAYTDEEAFSTSTEFSDAALRKYQQAGANALVVPFAKGFGLKASKTEIDQERDLINRAHRMGLKAGAYIRVDFLIPETVQDDRPDVEEWLARGMHGATSSYYPQQTFRKRLCLLHPGAVAWLEHLFAYASRELLADFLHLDGLGGLTSRPWDNCRCPRCLLSYRSWLKERLPTAAERERLFGICDLDRITFPEFEVSQALPDIISSPELQMWHRYLLDREEAWVRHVRRFTQKLNPALALTGNFGWSRAAGAPRWFARNVERLSPWLDALWAEDSDHLDFADGKIRSRLGVFKTAREYGVSVCHYHWQAEAEKIEASLALSLAANGGNLSCLGFSFRYLPHYSLGLEPKTRYALWMQAHWSLLARTVPWGEIALIRHPESLAWNNGKPAASARAMEQLLVHMQVPWRMFNTIDATLLRQVKTAILPDAECLSDAEIARLKSWVRRGGRLFLTGGTATHDENRRRRPRHGFVSVQGQGGIPAPENGLSPAQQWHHWLRNDFTEFATTDSILPGWKPLIHPYGQGAIGLWPTVAETPSSDLENFLAKLHGPKNLSIQGSPSLLVECNQEPTSGKILLHLIRTEGKAGTCAVTVRHALGWKYLQVLSPDARPPLLRRKGRTLHLSRLSRYALVVFSSAP